MYANSAIARAKGDYKESYAIALEGLQLAEGYKVWSLGPEITSHISRTFGHLLTSFDQDWLQSIQLQRYAEAIHEKSGALENCWGLFVAQLDTNE